MRKRNNSKPNRNEEPTDLEELIDKVMNAKGDPDRVTVGSVVEAVGTRTFGPVILMGGAIVFSPLSGIPGLPTVMALLIVITASQLLVGRRHIWLPAWLTKRSAPRDKFEAAMKFLCRPARWIDRLVRPRLTWVTHGIGLRVTALLSLLVAATMPVLELIPFSSSVAGAALSAFGLSLIAHDGLFAIIALAAVGATATLVIAAAPF